MKQDSKQLLSPAIQHDVRVAVDLVEILKQNIPMHLKMLFDGRSINLGVFMSEHTACLRQFRLDVHQVHAINILICQGRNLSADDISRMLNVSD
jgi:hypothetical protein